MVVGTSTSSSDNNNTASVVGSGGGAGAGGRGIPFVRADSASFKVCSQYAIAAGNPSNMYSMLQYVANEPRMRLRDQLIRYVYYTEMDQVVHFDSMDLFKAIYSATNSSAFFVAKRAERVCIDNESPEDFDKSLFSRSCGKSGYQLRWPQENYVHVLS